jgi:hypothetical protein
MRCSWIAVGVAFGWGLAADAGAATLPQHEPIGVIIIADEVNPNGLSDEELTQPADLEAAIRDPGNGLSIASVTAVDSTCLDEAVQALEDDGGDVLVYFAHRSATDCSGLDAQPRLDAAVEGFLQRGGGVVVFHHGLYTAPGKEAILLLFGGTANAIAWDTVDGQDVINVATDHFVTSNEVEYPAARSFADAGFGIPMAEYPVFNNSPDERYPGVQFIPAAGEERTILFASDYSGAQVLGYDLHRPDWVGHVVFYQPGEYQPNALDALDGNNFQILANAIYWVATTSEDPDDPTGDESSGGEPTTGEPDTTDATSSATSAVGTTGPVEDTDTDTTSSFRDGEGGCGCRSTSGGGRALLWGVLVFGLGRARARARARRSVV